MIITAKKYTFLPDEKSTGVKIKTLRNNFKINGKKMTVQMLSEKIYDEFGVDITDKAINKWEQGKSFPSIDNLLCLSKIFDTPIQEILLPDNLTNFSLYDVKRNYGFEMGWYEKQYPEFFTPTDFESEIKSRTIMDYLFQKAIFSYLTDKEKEIFLLKYDEFYTITDYGIDNYRLTENMTILDVLDKFLIEKYGYSIKQKIPTDDEFNSIIYSAFKVVDDIEFESGESFIFSYLFSRSKNDIDKVIASLNILERDVMITTLLALPMNKYDDLEKIYSSLKEHGAMRLSQENGKMYAINIEDENYQFVQFSLLQNIMSDVWKELKLIGYEEYLQRRNILTSNKYSDEILNLRGSENCD